MLTVREAKNVAKNVNFTKSYHMQFGGKYKGETLTKHYHKGTPSWLIMTRRCGEVTLIKRNAITLYEA